MSCGGEERQIWDAFIIDICVMFSTPKKPCTAKKKSVTVLGSSPSIPQAPEMVSFERGTVYSGVRGFGL